MAGEGQACSCKIWDKYTQMLELPSEITKEPCYSSVTYSYIPLKNSGAVTSVRTEAFFEENDYVERKASEGWVTAQTH